MRRVVTSSLLALRTNRNDPLWLATTGSTWRATYLQRIRLDAPASTRLKLLARVLALPTAALARALDINCDAPAELPAIFDQLANATCRTTLHEVTINAYWKPAAQAVTLDAAVLGPLALRELRLRDRAVRLTYRPPLARLVALELTPGSPDDLREVFERGGMPALRSLALAVDILAHRGWEELAGLEGMFEGTAAPQLVAINVVARDSALRERFLERLATSPLASRLRELKLRHCSITADEILERHRAALAHLLEPSTTPSADRC